MKIISPLRSKEEVAPLVSKGAEVFYFGLDSNLIFGSDVLEGNRRPWSFANFSSLKEVKEATELIHKNRKEAHLTLNEHNYSDKNLKDIVNFLKENHMFDAYIVTNLSLIRILKKAFPDMKIIASTGTHILNQYSIKFYKGLGVKQIVLPRCLTLREVEKLSKKFKEIEFEYFILNEDCLNIDGLCRFCHGVFDKDEVKNACKVLHDFKINTVDDFSERELARIKSNLKKYHKIMFNTCRVCDLKKLDKMGVKNVKIVGRGNNIEKKKKDVSFVKESIDILNKDKENYYTFINDLHKKIYGLACPNCLN